MEGQNNCPYLHNCGSMRDSCRNSAYTNCTTYMALQQEESMRAEREESDRENIPRIVKLASRAEELAARNRETISA